MISSFIIKFKRLCFYFIVHILIFFFSKRSNLLVYGVNKTKTKYNDDGCVLTDMTIEEIIKSVKKYSILF